MKNHGTFTQELYDYLNARMPSLGKTFNDATAHEIVLLSRMGLAPEGKGSTAKNKLADLIYGLDDKLFTTEPLPAPIPAPPAAPIPPKPEQPSTVHIGQSGFRLSQESLNKLKPVHINLRKCVERAIQISRVDFKVGQAARTLKEQEDAFRRGTTRTMKSKHLPNAQGTVYAVDLWAWVNGTVSWDFNYYYYIARAMDGAATELGVANHIRWGAVWDRVLSDFGVNSTDKIQIRKAYLSAIDDYKRRHAGSDFLDGPHFEWVA